jgi:hypothetical protein
VGFFYVFSGFFTKKHAGRDASMKKPLLAYKIILSVIGVFSLGILFYVVSQAGLNKTDTNTYSRATDIAGNLQSFTDSRGYAPGSLSAANIRNVPASITYTKLSENSYQFILTQSVGSDSSSSQNAATDGFLVIDPTHHKGNNCQTVKLNTPSNSYYPGSFTGSATGSFSGSASASGSYSGSTTSPPVLLSQ